MNYFVLLALLVVSVHQLNASAIECESVNAHGYWGSMANKVDGKQTCFLQETTSIDSPGSTISSDVRTVGKLRFDGNKKIHYLPDNVHNTFKNLMHYWAFDCSLTEISRSNFEKLSNMRTLLLHTNQIVKINSNTFKDLRVLETLELHSNKIKQINGAVFEKLRSLTAVNLEGNECINENFHDSTKIKEMPEAVTAKCGFEE